MKEGRRQQSAAARCVHGAHLGGVGAAIVDGDAGRDNEGGLDVPGVPHLRVPRPVVQDDGEGGHAGWKGCVATPNLEI